MKYPQALDGFGAGEVLVGVLEPLAEHRVPDHHVGLGVGRSGGWQLALLAPRQRAGRKPHLGRRICATKPNEKKEVS